MIYVYSSVGYDGPWFEEFETEADAFRWIADHQARDPYVSGDLDRDYIVIDGRRIHIKAKEVAIKIERDRR